MENIEAGTLKDMMNLIKNLSDKFFAYLSSSDGKKNLKVEKVEDINDRTQRITIKYKGKIPVYIDITPNKSSEEDEGYMDMTIRVADVNESGVSYKHVKGDDFEKKFEEACKKLIDKDLELSFGVTSSKELKVSLQKVVSAKSVDIRLCAITANYDISTAAQILDTALANDEFIEAIPETMTSFAIVDDGDDLDVATIEDFATEELVLDSLYQMLCAAVKFNMEIQELHWESAFSKDLFPLTDRLLYDAQRQVNDLGMWIIQVSNSVVSPYTIMPEMWFNRCDLTSPHSPQIESIGMETIFGVMDDYINTLDFFYPNIPHELQQEVNYWLSSLKEVRDIELKRT